MTSTQSAASPKPSPASSRAPEVVPRRLRPTRIAALFVATGSLLILWGRTNPYAALEQRWTGAGAEIAQQPVRQDPASSDPLHGENLRQTFESWPKPAVSAVVAVLMGNSQQFTCSLPKGVRADTTHEAPVMNDILASKLVEKAAHPITVYNASAPNQTMVEELWQGIYWFKVGTPRPKILLIASNFDTYRKTGIRNGFQTLLDDRAFVSALDRFPFADRPYGSEFASARRTFESRKEEGVTQQATGWTFEGWIRDRLDDSVPLYHARQQRKGNFLSVLYLLRVHMLQLRPTTKRHITGQPLAENLSALTDLVRLARASGAVTFIYNAPTNPAVSMFYEEEYRTYLDRLRALAKDESSYFADFSDAVPRDDWGYWIDGPDPIHFDERGHHTMAGRIDAAFGSQMAEVAAQ